MGKDIILACDLKSKEALYKLIMEFEEEKPFLKIGMEMFYKYGPELVKGLKESGYKIFLDLKLHDIPNTVKGAMNSLKELNIDMINVHAAGTAEMMRAAVEGITASDGSRPLVIAVTQLTSTSAEALKNELLIQTDMEETVMKYALNAKKAGLDGVVCSPLEVESVKKFCGSDFITVTPGVRYPDNDTADQKRVATPAYAKQVCSDYIVVGRPITSAQSPKSAYRRFAEDFIG